MKILLCYRSHDSGSSDPFTSLLPSGLPSIHALLRSRGIDSRLANFSRMSWSETERYFRREKPEVVGISQFTHNRFESLRLARIARSANPSCHVVLGGPHATLRYPQLLEGCSDIDGVVVGEGEETFLELVTTLQRGERPAGIAGLARRGTPLLPREPLRDLDSLPLAVRYLEGIGVDPREQGEFLITSRGCPASCRFCSSPRFWGRAVRFRSPASVVEEIRRIRERWGLLYFSFRDDTFTADRRRVLEICETLRRENIGIMWNCQSRVSAVDREVLVSMKRAGCESIQFGVESGSPRMLAALGKKVTPEQVRNAAAWAREAGIRVSVYLISGIPGENGECLEETLRLLEQVSPADGQVSPLVYYPGTELFEQGVKEGMIPADLFESRKGAMFPVRRDRFSEISLQRQMHALEKYASEEPYTERDFLAHEKLVGFCHASRVMEGEYLERQGRFPAAEKAYREIIEREPQNPWGWLLLAELFLSRGSHAEARNSLERLVELVPAHLPAYPLLEECCRKTGDPQGAGRYRRKFQGMKKGG